MAELRTFIFTDIVRSVALKSEMQGRDDTQRDRAFIETVLTPHRNFIDTDLGERGGRIVSTAGDGHFLVFSDTMAAAQWAIDVQRRHWEEPITTPAGSRVEVRISMHVGVPQIDPRDPNNFVGKPVDYAARLNDFARGGQILCSRAVAAILEDVQLEGLSLHSHGMRMLRGIGRVEVYELVYREAGPMETLYHPVNEAARQWTVIPPSPLGGNAAYPAPAPGSTSTQATVLHAPMPTRLGNYELQELLGSGGMGDVYKARHTLFERVRAVKVIKQRLVDAGRTDVIRRFYQEIKAVGKLEHKNVVVAVESSTPEDNVHYLVMEYIEGISLDELVTRHGPLSVPDACEAIRQAARGLAYIHKHGMVHRDIKPSNLMLTVVERSDTYRVNDSEISEVTQEVPLVKILDLGLALLVDENQDRLTQLGQQAMGTGMYMSPEQWKTTSVDIRADIYSLGCTLYHVLAGRPPFLDSDLKPEKAHEKSKVPPIVGPTQVPRKLWEVVRKMLAKDPADRFQTPEEVAAALAPFCEGHQLVELAHLYCDEAEQDMARVGTTALSRPDIETLPIDSKASRPPRWRRRPVLAAVCLVAVVAVVAALVPYLRDPALARSPYLTEAADTILALPGLDGLWWFEETPWLTPHERISLLAGMRESDWRRLRNLLQNSDIREFYTHLQRMSAAANVTEPRELAMMLDGDAFVRRRAGSVLSDYDPLLRSVERHRSEEKLQPLLDELTAIDHDQRSPATWHLLGVLQTHVQDFQNAEASLRTAESQYRRLANISSDASARMAQSLMSLVASDLGNLYFARSEFAASRVEFSKALDPPAGTRATPHQIYALGMRSQAGIYDRHADPAELKADLDAASRLAQEMQLEANHPLRAFLHERRAHLALETWQLNDAIRHAEQAARLRETFANLETLATAQPSISASRAPVPGSHHAQQGWFRAQQIVALALHFQGSLSPGSEPGRTRTEAWVDFNRLEEMLSRSARVELTAEQARAWQQLMPNFRGRKADAELFTMGSFEEAAKSYEDGINFARDTLDWEENPEKRPFLVFMMYKRTIALALARQQSRAAEVLRVASELESRDDGPGQEARFEAYRQVASLLIEDTPDYENLRAALHAGAKALEQRVRDRDNRQLWLFVAAYLRELGRAGLVTSEWDAELLATINGLLRPLKTGDQINYMERIKESASRAVVHLRN